MQLIMIPSHRHIIRKWQLSWVHLWSTKTKFFQRPDVCHPVRVILCELVLPLGHHSPMLKCILHFDTILTTYLLGNGVFGKYVVITSGIHLMIDQSGLMVPQITTYTFVSSEIHKMLSRNLLGNKKY